MRADLGAPVGFLGRVLGGRFRLVDIIGEACQFGLTDGVTEASQLIRTKETFAPLFRILFDATRRIKSRYQNLPFAGEGIETSHNSQNPIGLIRSIPHLGVKLGNIGSRYLFSFSATQVGEHDPGQQTSIECSSRGLFSSYRHAQSGTARPILAEFLSLYRCGVTTICHRAERFFGERARPVGGKRANLAEGHTPCGGTSPRSGPVLDDV